MRGVETVCICERSFSNSQGTCKGLRSPRHVVMQLLHFTRYTEVLLRSQGTSIPTHARFSMPLGLRTSAGQGLGVHICSPLVGKASHQSHQSSEKLSGALCLLKHFAQTYSAVTMATGSFQATLQSLGTCSETGAASPAADANAAHKRREQIRPRQSPSRQNRSDGYTCRVRLHVHKMVGDCSRHLDAAVRTGDSKDLRLPAGHFYSRVVHPALAQSCLEMKPQNRVNCCCQPWSCQWSCSVCVYIYAHRFV